MSIEMNSHLYKKSLVKSHKLIRKRIYLTAHFLKFRVVKEIKCKTRILVQVLLREQ